MAHSKQPNIAGKTVVVAGDLILFPDRAAFRQLVEHCGGKLEETVTEETDYLISNEPVGACSVPVLSETELLTLLWGIKPKLLSVTVEIEGMGTFEAKEGVLLKFTGVGRHVEIPKGITKIGEQAFFCCDTLESVVIPAGVTVIGEKAFTDCEQLHSLTLPRGLKTIGSDAFAACHLLSRVEIPKGVVEIGKSAFQYSGIVELTLPEGLIAIREKAFSSCFSLKEVTLPQSLEILEDEAFGNCNALTTVTDPAFVKHASDRAFYGCRQLADARGFLIVGTTFVSAFLRGITRLEIPAGITVIGDYALYDTEDLETVIVPDSVQTIGKGFLCGLYKNSCKNLSSVTLPAHIIRLEPEALYMLGDRLRFLEAPSLPLTEVKTRQLMIPATVGYLCRPELYTDPMQMAAYQKTAVYQKKRILEAAFREDLVAVVAAYVSMGKIHAQNFQRDFMQPALEADAFHCVAFLMEWKNENISPEDEEKQLLRELERDSFNARDMRKLWQAEAVEGGYRLVGYKGRERDVFMPHRIGKKPVVEVAFYSPVFGTVAGDWSLYHFRSVTFAGGIPRIGHKAFYQCDTLETVTLAQGTESIGDSAFAKCTALKSMTIPNTVTRIGSGAFCWCKSLETVTLPAGLKTVSQELFSGCGRLREVILPEQVEVIEKAAFRWCFKLSRLQLPTTLRCIGPAAFLGCRPLRTVRVPEGVTEIGDEAFAECYQLRQLHLPASLRRLGDQVFRDCGQLTIYGPADSFVRAWAEEKNLPFVAE